MRCEAEHQKVIILVREKRDPVPCHQCPRRRRKKEEEEEEAVYIGENAQQQLIAYGEIDQECICTVKIKECQVS